MHKVAKYKALNKDDVFKLSFRVVDLNETLLGTMCYVVNGYIVIMKKMT